MFLCPAFTIIATTTPALTVDATQPNSGSATFYNDTYIEFDWSVSDAGSTVGDVYLDGSLVAPGYASGDYSQIISSEGTHTWYVIVRGVQSDSETFSTAAPPTITVNDNSQYVNQSFYPTWSMSYGSDYADIYVDGVFQITDYSGGSRIDLPDTGSPHTIRITLNGDAAHYGEATVYGMTLSLDGDGSSMLDTDNWSWYFTQDPAINNADLYLDGSYFTNGSSGTFTGGLSDGSHTAQVKYGDAFSNVVTFTVTAPPSNSASFLGYDSSTQGTWNGVYGADGYLIPDTTYGPYPEYGSTFLMSPPMYATLGSSSGVNAYTWANNDAFSNGDGRALEYPGAGGPRIASTWYSGSSETYDITITGGAAKTVRLYMLDWDNIGRGAYVEIFDGDTMVTLASAQYIDASTPSASAYYNGTWLSYSINGHVKITVTCYTGANATCSGIFFDA